MNLNNDPTPEQLKDLYAKCDDEAGNHVLWVDRNGEVCISQLPGDITPSCFVEIFPTNLFRYESFSMGNGYVGQEAAEDHEHILIVFNSLRREWAAQNGSTSQRYIDSY